MKNSKTLFREIVSRVSLNEGSKEIRAIVHILFENFFDVSKTDIMTGKMVPYEAHTAERLQKALERINRNEPVQYVVGEQYFYGRKFHVNSSVLIPRPETEELIRVIISYENALKSSRLKSTALRIMDIGTGSGCIAVTLFHEIPDAEIYASDISNAALSVASDNAEEWNAKVTLIEHNILREKIPLASLDVIVSNPPYVTLKEKRAMRSNVIDHEPHVALFVPDDDPLMFYKAIVRQSREALNPEGLLAVEIHENFADEVSGLFIGAGFTEVGTVKDISGKQRVVTGLNGKMPA